MGSFLDLDEQVKTELTAQLYSRFRSVDGAAKSALLGEERERKDALAVAEKKDIDV